VGGVPKKSVSGNSLRPRRGGPAESHREYYVGEWFLGRTPPRSVATMKADDTGRVRPQRAAQSPRGLTVSPRLVCLVLMSSTSPSSESRRRAPGRRDPLM
jgi:hypothetical protein